MTDPIVPLQPTSPIGTWRRFGEVGPVYEVIGVADADRAVMRIRVVETSEELG